MTDSDCYDVPDNIPCAACNRGKSSYALWNFERGKKAICTDCARKQYTFDPVGNALDAGKRVVGVRVNV